MVSPLLMLLGGASAFAPPGAAHALLRTSAAPKLSSIVMEDRVFELKLKLGDVRTCTACAWHVARVTCMHMHTCAWHAHTHARARAPCAWHSMCMAAELPSPCLQAGTANLRFKAREPASESVVVRSPTPMPRGCGPVHSMSRGVEAGC